MIYMHNIYLLHINVRKREIVDLVDPTKWEKSGEVDKPKH